ncbi:DNA-dependent ATPase mgs1 [Meyerozyma guilliermondii]
MDEECPICNKKFPQSLIERHVNSCLDSREAENTSKRRKRSPDTEKNQEVPDAFAALGLARNSSSLKRTKSGSQPKIKTEPSMTSIRIAERRLEMLKRAEERKLKSENQAVDKDDETTGIQESETTQEEQVISEKNDNVSAETKTDVIDLENASDPSPVPTQEPLRQSQALTNRQERMKLEQQASIPLAQRLRPTSLKDFFGQEKLVGPNGLLTNLINSDQIPSFILWGVPGVGKTSLARIIANVTSSRFVEVSGASTSTTRLREVFDQAKNEKALSGRRTILFLDEIHRFNKAVQDLLLPVIERGLVTAIGATTENPSFTLNNALLSRMHTFVMEPLTHSALVKIIDRGLLEVNRTRKHVYNLHLVALSRDAIDYVANISSGDSRVALNILETINAYLSGVSYSAFSNYEEPEKAIKVPEKFGVIKISMKELKPLLSTRNYHQMYDRVGENHYDIISAFHKSVRGSDADAAVFYLAKMLSGGEDPMFIVRRMIVIASEDIGLRDSSCLPFVVAVKDALEFVGMPEGEIILAHCAVKLARALKSTKSYRALRTAQSLLKEQPELTSIPVPLHLRNAPTKLMKEMGYGDTYRYNPSFENGVVRQQYTPEALKDQKFVEDTHLGTARDPLVPDEEYSSITEADKEYEEFKKQRRKEMEQETLESEERHTYDEFLAKDDQPEYFDGEERDAYSDDPDCTHNFDQSYDENLSQDQQPQYYRQFSER